MKQSENQSTVIYRSPGYPVPVTSLICVFFLRLRFIFRRIYLLFSNFKRIEICKCANDISKPKYRAVIRNRIDFNNGNADPNIGASISQSPNQFL